MGTLNAIGYHKIKEKFKKKTFSSFRRERTGEEGKRKREKTEFLSRSLCLRTSSEG